VAVQAGANTGDGEGDGDALVGLGVDDDGAGSGDVSAGRPGLGLVDVSGGEVDELPQPATRARQSTDVTTSLSIRGAFSEGL
jgi:hypothetical protein